MVSWSVGNINTRHLDIFRISNSHHMWSTALILSLEDISDPPHVASSIESTLTINFESISIFKFYNLVSLRIVFIMLGSIKCTIDSELNILHIIEGHWHNGELCIFWNDNLSISCIWSVGCIHCVLKNFRIFKFLSCSWRFTKSDTSKIKKVNCRSSTYQRQYSFKHFYI